MGAIRPMIRPVRAAASDGLSLTMVLCGALQECVGSKVAMSWYRPARGARSCPRRFDRFKRAARESIRMPA